MENRIYLSSSISNKIATKHIYGSHDNKKIDTHLLSGRELEIFQLIGKGYKRNEIAKRLNININTMESHRRKIREKLSIENSSELTKIAVQYAAGENR
ncbi:MAG: hypothetical protein CVV49_02930 [Spirochaetae bacterium HGW-Spirochaetae-5]|nr:MAG: hypothetical protein CVV49_02930 [Spirochaetae bacterium HGW-Spirochaetae-5]